MINPSWRRFLTRKRFDVDFESKHGGLSWGLRAVGEKESTTNLYKDREIHPSVKDLQIATSKTQQASSWTANL